MLSYHNDPAIKVKFQQRFADHRAADAVIQGTGYNNGRGCFVGCTLKNYDHSQFPIELGWPEWLAHLADKIFEGIPKAEAPQFGTDLLDAVPVGVDLGPVRWKLAIWRHTRDLERLRGNREPYAEQCREALRQVIAYCEAELLGTAAESAARSAAESAAWSAWSAAWSAARSAAESAARSAARSAESAAESAARSAAESAARSAAESAAWSAESAAESAARSAARSAAWSAAESAHFKNERDALLGFIRELK